MSAITLLPTPWSFSSRTKSVKTKLAVCASGARAPAAVASCAIRTVVCRTMASMSKLTFIEDRYEAPLERTVVQVLARPWWRLLDARSVDVFLRVLGLQTAGAVVRCTLQEAHRHASREARIVEPNRHVEGHHGFEGTLADLLAWSVASAIVDARCA